MIMLGGQFNGGRMVITEVASLMEGACSCYIAAQFNGGRIGHVTEVVTLMEGEWTCYSGNV